MASHHPGRIAGIEIFTQGTIFNKKQTLRQVLVTLPHLHGVGVLCDEDRVVNMHARDEDLMNSLLLRDVYGCRQFFKMPVDLLFGDISMYPHHTKKRTVSRHNLRLPPWHDIRRICIGFKQEEHI